MPPVLPTSAYDLVYPAEPTQRSTGGGDQARSTTASTVTRSKRTSTADVQTSTSLWPRPVVTEGAFCEARLARKVEWPRTAAGTTVLMECPNNENSQCSLFVHFYCLIVFVLTANANFSWRLFPSDSLSFFAQLFKSAKPTKISS